MSKYYGKRAEALAQAIEYVAGVNIRDYAEADDRGREYVDPSSTAFRLAVLERLEQEDESEDDTWP